MATGFTCSVNQVINCRETTTASILFCAGTIFCCVVCSYTCFRQVGHQHLMVEACTWLESRSHSWFCNPAYLYGTKSSVLCAARLCLVHSSRRFDGMAQKMANVSISTNKSTSMRNIPTSMLSILAVLVITVKDEVHDSYTWAMYVRFSYIRSRLPRTSPFAYTVKPNKVSVMKMMTAKAPYQPFCEGIHTPCA